MTPQQNTGRPIHLAIEVEHSARGDAAVLLLRGEVDYASAPQLREAITEALGGVPVLNRIVIDMAGVTMLDSTGLGTLVVGYRICNLAGVRLTVRKPSPFVARILAMTGVDRTLTH